MKACEVYSKTMKFVWLKLAMGGCVLLIPAVLGLIMFGIAAAADSDDLFSIMMLIWLHFPTVAAYFAVDKLVAGSVKAKFKSLFRKSKQDVSA